MVPVYRLIYEPLRAYLLYVSAYRASGEPSSPGTSWNAATASWQPKEEDQNEEPKTNGCVAVLSGVW